MISGLIRGRQTLLKKKTVSYTQQPERVFIIRAGAVSVWGCSECICALTFHNAQGGTDHMNAPPPSIHRHSRRLLTTYIVEYQHLKIKEPLMKQHQNPAEIISSLLAGPNLLTESRPIKYKFPCRDVWMCTILKKEKKTPTICSGYSLWESVQQRLFSHLKPCYISTINNASSASFQKQPQYISEQHSKGYWTDQTL